MGGGGRALFYLNNSRFTVWRSAVCGRPFFLCGIEIWAVPGVCGREGACASTHGSRIQYLGTHFLTSPYYCLALRERQV